MGKKAKKKVRAPQREKSNDVTSLKAVLGSKVVPVETSEDVVTVVKERKGCIHVEKGVNLVELATKDWSAGHVVCEDCRENAGDRRGSKGKAKAGKKKGLGGEGNTDGKAIWVCLQCGHRACGGVGMPTTPKSHAVRHARQTRHPMVINYENPQLRWCFQCSTLILVAKLEEKGEHIDVISDAVKIIQNQLVREVLKDAESSSLGSGSFRTGLDDESVTSNNDNYVVRGLMNLGNTCFFNSVMQNLLAMDKLRGYFLNIDGSYGPLTISLKKLFAETCLDTGKKGALSPKSFFGCICAKAPQFRGYQQQDSHELLRCLLDGLSMEELNARKQIRLIHENDVCPNPSSTFVDVAFGGQVSSTVCCLECGHASTVFEPFLDLSLPVPTRKPPKKTQNVSVAKRAKVPVPPKKAPKIRTKSKKDANGDLNASQAESNCEPSQEASSIVENTASSIRSDIFDESSVDQVPESQLSLPVGDTTNLYTGDSGILGSINQTTAPDNDVVYPQQEEKEVDMSWLDFLDSETDAGEQDIQIADFDASVSVDSVCEIKQLIHNATDVGPVASEAISDRTLSSSGITGDDEVPLVVQDSQVILLPYKEESLPDLESMEGQASSSFTGPEEDASDFGGFGGLFDEPDPAFGPSPRPDGEGNMKDSGTANSFCSESDPDEVDDTSPVSVGTCLTYFTKPEILLKEQGWYCEKCSKVALTQKRKSEQILVASVEAGTHIATQGSPSSNQNGHLSNGQSIENGATNLLMQNGNIDDDRDETRHMQDSVDSLPANGDTKANNLACMDSSSDSNCANELNVASATVEVPKINSGGISDNELEDNEDTETSFVMMARDATKRLLIEKAPSILTIHLKRFSQDARGRLSKLNGHIAFGETIDLRPYINPRCTDGDTYIYHLAGVVVHLGTMRGGHYEAYIKGGKNNTWYHTSDAYVREATLEEVLRSEAYLLFYVKME